MFIETLEFTIPVDLCDLFSSLKRGPKSNMEFPASVNSYGTTQDANIQVLLRANKLTFKVDGVSSNSSMISKSECKTLKLSVFDVDTAIGAEEEYNNSYSDTVTQNMQYSNPVKRTRDYSVPVSSPPPAKSSRNSFSDAPSRNIPQYSSTPRNSNQNQSKSNDTPVNIKQEPEDPDLIEIEPDPEPDDIVPKKETPYMQIDYSSDVPHTQTSQSALERLSHPHSSHSQSPASSSSSFHQNVPHVQDYSEPGPSQGYHGDQSQDDFLVFQDDDDGGEDNEADYSNDDGEVYQVEYLEGVETAKESLRDKEKIDSKDEAKKYRTRNYVRQNNDDGNVLQKTDEAILINIASQKNPLGSAKASDEKNSNFGKNKNIHLQKSMPCHASCKKNVKKNVGVSESSGSSTREKEGCGRTSCVKKVLFNGKFGLWCSWCNYFTLKNFNMDRHLTSQVHLCNMAIKEIGQGSSKDVRGMFEQIKKSSKATKNVLSSAGSDKNFRFVTSQSCAKDPEGKYSNENVKGEKTKTSSKPTENVPLDEGSSENCGLDASHPCSKVPQMTKGSMKVFCPKCSFSCRSRKVLRAHKLSHLCIECSLCDKKFTGRVYLLQHMTYKHPKEKDVPRWKSRNLKKNACSLKCGLCSKCFETRKGLSQHVVTHVSRMYKCNACKKSFPLIEDLHKHHHKCLKKPVCIKGSDEISHYENLNSEKCEKSKSNKAGSSALSGSELINVTERDAEEQEKLALDDCIRLVESPRHSTE